MTVEDLWILPLEGERKPTVFLDTPDVEHQSQFSPNGSWLAYVSTEPGRYEVFIQAFPHGGKWQISTDDGQQPKWRGDGKELFYIAGNQEFKSVDLNATSSSLDVGTTHSLFETSLPVGGRNWYAVSPDGQRFLVRVPAEGGDSGTLIVTLNWPATAPKR